jgi:hypothetical protein
MWLHTTVFECGFESHAHTLGSAACTSLSEFSSATLVRVSNDTLTSRVLISAQLRICGIGYIEKQACRTQRGLSVVRKE